MKTESELEEDILNVIMEIKKEFPELSKYILEMPTQAPDKGSIEIDNSSLKEYHNSLNELLLKYREEQNN